MMTEIYNSLDINKNIKNTMEQPPQPPQPPHNDSTKNKLIGQGGFGCVFKPDLPCDNDTIHHTHNNYISKIQLITKKTYDLIKKMEQTQMEETMTETTNINYKFINEINIGKIIQTVPSYYKYFAPIIKTCLVDIKTIDQNEINKCDVFTSYIDEYMDFPSMQNANDNDDIFVSCKIKFVEGKHLHIILNEYKKMMKSLSIQPDKAVFLQKQKEMFDLITGSFQQLMESISLIQDDNIEHIIHFDLKTPNIIFNTKTKKPVIIDFGISFTKKMLLESKHPHDLQKIFTHYSTTYRPWCVDIVLISYIVNKVLHFNAKENTNVYEKGLVNVEEMKIICKHFVQDNMNIFALLTNDRGTHFENMLCEYIDSFKEKAWKVLIANLSKNYLRWDVYSIAITYLDYLDYLFENIIVSTKNIHLEESPNNMPHTYDKLFETIQNIILFVPVVSVVEQVEM